MNEKIDLYLEQGCMRCPLGGTPECKVHNWPNELNELRRIVLECELKEELKWGVPCYTFNGANILIVSAFKEYAALSFFKGSLISDPLGLLVAPGPNAQSGKLFKFTGVKDILDIEDEIKAYIFEAIEVEKAGLKVESKKLEDMEYPEELITKLEEDVAFRNAFEALTPGRQKGYIYFFSAPKQSKTRISRIEKLTPKIFEGKGPQEY